MIHLIGVSKSYFTHGLPKVVLEPTTLSVPTQRRIGVLGRNGAGKSTLLRMIAGEEQPDQGEILREGSVSWPLGFAGGFHGDLTGAENVAFVSRIYGADVDETLAFVMDFSELAEYIHMPFRTYSSGMRARLAFGLSMAIDFSCYLVDEITAVGDQWFQEKCRRAFRERCQRSGLLLVSHSLSVIREYCDMALVLKDGRLYPFEKLMEAERFYELQ